MTRPGTYKLLSERQRWSLREAVADENRREARALAYAGVAVGRPEHVEGIRVLELAIRASLNGIPASAVLRALAGAA